MAVITQTEPEDQQGPTAHGDPMGTPTVEEKVLWKGRPELSLLSRTVFHTRTVGLYFAALIAIAAIMGNVTAVILCAVGGVAAVAILYLIAWRSVSTTLYILTDQRLIMRIGMAIETRINVPLKHVTSANLRLRGKDHGDIDLELGGERLLGYLLLWPHARPWKFGHPQPMLRAVPEAQKVAALLADACAAHVAIHRNLSEVNVPSPASDRDSKAPAKPAVAATTGRGDNTMKGQLRGAPA